MYKIPKRNFFTVIHQAEVAYRELLGKNRTKLNPGLRINLPLLHNLYRVSLKEHFVSLDNQDAYTKDNVPVLVSGSLFYKINDAHKACYEVVNCYDSIYAVGISAMRAVIGQFEYEGSAAEQKPETNSVPPDKNSADPGAVAVTAPGGAGNTGNGATAVSSQAAGSTKLEGTKEAKPDVETDPKSVQPKK